MVFGAKDGPFHFMAIVYCGERFEGYNVPKRTPIKGRRGFRQNLLGRKG